MGKKKDRQVFGRRRTVLQLDDDKDRRQDLYTAVSEPPQYGIFDPDKPSQSQAKVQASSDDGVDNKLIDFLKEIESIDDVVDASERPDAEEILAEDSAATPAVPEPTSRWQQIWDDNVQYYYYWNTETNEVTWDVPEELQQQVASMTTEDACKATMPDEATSEFINEFSQQEDSNSQFPVNFNRGEVTPSELPSKDVKAADKTELNTKMKSKQSTNMLDVSSVNSLTVGQLPVSLRGKQQKEPVVSLAPDYLSKTDGTESAAVILPDGPLWPEPVAEIGPQLPPFKHTEKPKLSEKGVPISEFAGEKKTQHKAPRRRGKHKLTSSEKDKKKKLVPYVKDNASSDVHKSIVSAVEDDAEADNQSFPDEIEEMELELQLLKKQQELEKLEKEEKKKDTKNADRKTAEGLAADAVNTTDDDDDVLARVAELADTITSKLGFLDILSTGISKLQLLLIETETRMKDWQEGGLSSSYFVKCLTAGSEQLEEYEQTASPPGWSCCWDRTYKRYFYVNDITGESQWDYPIVERDMEEKKKVLSTSSDERTSKEATKNTPGVGDAGGPQAKKGKPEMQIATQESSVKKISNKQTPDKEESKKLAKKDEKESSKSRERSLSSMSTEGKTRKSKKHSKKKDKHEKKKDDSSSHRAKKRSKSEDAYGSSKRSKKSTSKSSDEPKKSKKRSSSSKKTETTSSKLKHSSAKKRHSSKASKTSNEDDIQIIVEDVSPEPASKVEEPGKASRDPKQSKSRKISGESLSTVRDDSATLKATNDKDLQESKKLFVEAAKTSENEADRNEGQLLSSNDGFVQSIGSERREDMSQQLSTTFVKPAQTMSDNSPGVSNAQNDEQSFDDLVDVEELLDAGLAAATSGNVQNKGIDNENDTDGEDSEKLPFSLVPYDFLDQEEEVSANECPAASTSEMEASTLSSSNRLVTYDEPLPPGTDTVALPMMTTPPPPPVLDDSVPTPPVPPPSEMDILPPPPLPPTGALNMLSALDLLKTASDEFDDGVDMEIEDDSDDDTKLVTASSPPPLSLPPLPPPMLSSAISSSIAPVVMGTATTTVLPIGQAPLTAEASDWAVEPPTMVPPPSVDALSMMSSGMVMTESAMAATPYMAAAPVIEKFPAVRYTPTQDGGSLVAKPMLYSAEPAYAVEPSYSTDTSKTAEKKKASDSERQDKKKKKRIDFCQTKSSGLLLKKKGMSEMVQKWQQIKDQVREENDQPEVDDQQKHERWIEQWKKQAIESGEALDNPNFTPVSMDWQTRVQLARAKKESQPSLLKPS